MRWGLVLLGLCASTTVALGQPCDQRKSWPKVRACLERDHVRVTPLYEVDGAKLVALVADHAEATPLRLYVQHGEEWKETSFYGLNNPSTELLGFKRVDEHRYRIDQGMLIQSAQRIWLRRQLTTLCTDTSCRTVVTACDAFTDGRSSGTFRGALHAEGSSLFVVGDDSHAGPYCTPVATVFRREPLGDPIE